MSPTWIGGLQFYLGFAALASIATFKGMADAQGSIARFKNSTGYGPFASILEVIACGVTAALLGLAWPVVALKMFYDNARSG